MITVENVHKIAIKEALYYEHVILIYLFSRGSVDSIKEYLSYKPDAAKLLNKLQELGFILEYEFKRDLLKPRLTRIKTNASKCRDLFKGYHIKETVKASISGIVDWIQEYRLLFRGKKPKAMGDKNKCLQKMRWFYEKYPEYADKELIMNAAKRHIASKQGDNYMYMRQADYFIRKPEKVDDSLMDISELATYCEELQLRETEGPAESESPKYGQEVI